LQSSMPSMCSHPRGPRERCLPDHRQRLSSPCRSGGGQLWVPISKSRYDDLVDDLSPVGGGEAGKRTVDGQRSDAVNRRPRRVFCTESAFAGQAPDGDEIVQDGVQHGEGISLVRDRRRIRRTDGPKGNAKPSGLSYRELNVRSPRHPEALARGSYWVGIGGDVGQACRNEFGQSLQTAGGDGAKQLIAIREVAVGGVGTYPDGSGRSPQDHRVRPFGSSSSQGRAHKRFADLAVVIGHVDIGHILRYGDVHTVYIPLRERHELNEPPSQECRARHGLSCRVRREQTLSVSTDSLSALFPRHVDRWTTDRSH
jgi:hypothetical protein